MTPLMLLLLTYITAGPAIDPADERKAALISRLHKRLCEEDLKISDLPEEDGELTALLADMGFGGLERTQLRKALRESPCANGNRTAPLPEKVRRMDDEKSVNSNAAPRPQEATLQASMESHLTTLPPENVLHMPLEISANASEAMSQDEELARALQEEEYAAARTSAMMNASGRERGAGGPVPQIDEFLRELLGGAPGAGDKAASGVVIRRSVPGDHSCLFSAIAYVAEGPQAVIPAKANELREVCAQNVLKDPDPAKRALLLGVNNVEEYAKWIRDPEHWGGENEIIVLAKHYNLEVAVVSTQSMRIIVYGSDNPNCTKKAYLLYTGQHYDPLVAAPSTESVAADERRTFPKGDRSYDRLALTAARKHLEQPTINLHVNLPWGDKKDKDQTYKPVNDTGVTLEDVKGCDEAKEEVKEVVLYLRDPDRFTRLGAKLPRGILLTGSPGTGKTLMARGVAGEAKAAFLQCSGSEFDEEYVGVGARRIRNLFEQARNHTPCIVFMDELDAVGGKRQSREASYHRQTLNQLLTELDGFKQNKGLVLIAATNFPEALDPALTRPGRIDKTIHIPLPDLRGRTEILRLHAKNVTLEENADLGKVAQRTTGMTGADLANLINIAAIRAAGEELPYVPMLYLEEAYDRVAVGATRRSPMSEEEKNTTAYHEGGHTLVSMKTVGTDPIHKATILPRGNALGITWSVREGEKYSERLYELQAKLDMMMGGRAAEELVFGRQQVSAGCTSDLKGAKNLARAMVMQYGMGGEEGELSMYYDFSDYQVLSDQHKNALDDRINVLLRNAYERAMNVLQRNEVELHRIAEALMAYETLDAEEIKLAINGKRAEIQERHNSYKAKLANYTAMSLAPKQGADEQEKELQAAIALSLGKDVDVENSTGQDSPIALSASKLHETCFDKCNLGLCVLAYFLIAVIGHKKLHNFQKPRKGLHEPLMST